MNVNPQSRVDNEHPLLSCPFGQGQEVHEWRQHFDGLRHWRMEIDEHHQTGAGGLPVDGEL